MMNIIFRKSEKKLLRYLSHLLVARYHYDNVIKTKDYIYAEGNIPVMLVAHLDTVHLSLPHQIFRDQKANVLWSPEGLGADDRAGVWGILQLITQEQKPYILFTTGEETGGQGAYSVIDEIKSIPPVNFIIELDRKGKNDAVFYDCDNEDFTNYIEGYGFVKDYGSFSDISIICPEWGIAGVNLSTGHYHAHTKEEYLNLNELNEVLDRIRMIFNTLPEYPFEYIERDRSSDYKSYCDFSNGYFYCTECRTYVNLNKESKIRDVCNDCFDNVFEIE